MTVGPESFRCPGLGLATSREHVISVLGRWFGVCVFAMAGGAWWAGVLDSSGLARLLLRLAEVEQAGARRTSTVQRSRAVAGFGRTGRAPDGRLDHDRTAFP